MLNNHSFIHVVQYTKHSVTLKSYMEAGYIHQSEGTVKHEIFMAQNFRRFQILIIFLHIIFAEMATDLVG